MDLLNIENSENSHISLKERREKGAWLCTPVILTGAILLSLSYIIDIIFAGTSELGIGETSAPAKILYGIGSIINKLISPLLSGGIALYIGGLSALSAGLIGGMLTGMGVTLSFSSGNTGAMTGIYGSLLAGLVAGYTSIAAKAILRLVLKKQSNIESFVCPAVSLLATTAIVFITDGVSQIINGLASVGIAATGEFSRLLLVILLSIMITADIGGPFYLASLVYAVASIATDEPEIMAAVAAAGCVPALSIGLAGIIFKDRFSKKERIFSIAGIFCGLCGISQVAIPFYATRLHRVIIPGLVGGTITGVLSLLFGCYASSPAGGFLSIAGTGTVLYFILAVLSGVLFSTAIMGYTLEPVESSDISERKEEETKLRKATA